MLGDSLYLENIQEYVHDEEKIVSELFFFVCKFAPYDVYPCPHVYESLHSVSVARGGHSHMCHISGCDRGHRRLLGVVTGSPKDFGVVTGSPKTFGLGPKVTEGFLVWSRGYEGFSALSHAVTEQCCAVLCKAESHIRVHRMVPQVPSSSAVHALSESILY